MDTKLFECIVGSTAYGTNTLSSDEDKKFVYAQDESEILGFGYVPNRNINKDYVGYEIRRFIELLCVANPTCLEILYSPEDCIIYKHSAFEILLEHRDLFLTQECKNSFGGFAYQQIKRSKGHNKKMNWEQNKTERKSVIDFCYVVDGEGVVKQIEKWLNENNFSPSKCGLTKLNNMPFCYAVYIGDNYKGICSENGNDVHLSSIPKGEKPVIIMSFNKDAYSIHCKEYREYQEWLTNRNLDRFVENENHNQKIDSKNLLHSRRLIDIALEIGEFGKLNIRRPNADYLLKIKRGEIPLNKIIEDVEKDIILLDELYAKSNLPLKADINLAEDLMLEIRNKIK